MRVIVFWCLVVHLTSTFGTDITVDLSSYNPNVPESSVFTQFHNFSEPLVLINVDNIGDSVGFIVVQVHSYSKNVTLRNNGPQNTQNKAIGTNIGLFYAQESSNATFFLTQETLSPITIMVVVTVYKETDPVPGGCNLVLNTKEAPYQKISYTDDLITVDFQAPSGLDVDCDWNPIATEKYHLYLPENDNSEASYFKYLARMITVEDIVAHGYRVRDDEGYYKYRTLYSAYRGTGEVFAVVARHRNASAAYVPVITFACDYANNYRENCQGPQTTHWKIMLAVTLLLGIFLAFGGQYFFKTALTVASYACGVLLTQIIISQLLSASFETKSTISLIAGLGFSVAALWFWFKFGSPLLSILQALCLCGCTLAALIFYSPWADAYPFTNNTNFWCLYFGFVACCVLLLMTLQHRGHIFATSLIGSFAVIVACSYYLGGHVQYVTINAMRRATVANFNMAIIDPPYQYMDIILLNSWMVLWVLSFWVQMKIQRGRSPFPSRSVGLFSRSVASSASEHTPLLQPDFV